LNDRYFQQTFANGLTLVAEKMPAVQSAAMSLLIPAGSATDPAGQIGPATVLSDLVFRGAGSRDSRALSEHLDSLGLHRSSGASVYHTRFAAAAGAENVMEGLAVYADIVRRPMLPADGFESSRELALHAIDGVEDEPRQKLLIRLREKHLPDPLGRNTMGETKDLMAMTSDRVNADFERRYQPQGAILGLAGKIDFAEVKEHVERLFGDWPANPAPAPLLTRGSERMFHETQQSEQTHIGVAWDSIPETHEDYYVVRLIAEALGGGMSGRLFTEVREKRGLCYSVWAGFSSLKDLGFMMGYAGTSNDRAQATLDCFMDELARLSAGIQQDELDRAKISLKASTIMQGESTSSRSGAVVHDYFVRGRIRTLDEIKAAIESVTLERANAYVAKHVPGPFTIVTVGPKALTLKSAAV
jgi:predicted Zn-dependent peptidase